MASNEFNRVLQTTIAEYVLGAEDNIIRNRKLPAMMKAKGRITYNHSGHSLNWGIRYKRRPVSGYADGDVVTFSRSDTHKRAELPWRGLNLQDMVTKKEKLMNKGRPALIQYFSDLTKDMMGDMEEGFHAQYYVDGNAAGNEKLLHGYDSFTGTSGVATTLVMTPSDTYAELSTVLGNYGGSWSGNWPVGTGDTEYDFWSPVLVDYTDADWTATTDTWPNTCREAMRYGILAGKRNDSIKGMLDTVVAGQNLYRQFADTLDESERAIVNQGSGKPTLRNLGWGDTVFFEGAEVTWEYGVPVDANGVEQAYGWNWDECELCSLQGKLFVPEGPFYDESTKSSRFNIDMFGNFKFNPRYFVKWVKGT